MIDHIRHLLVNDGSVPGIAKVSDAAADAALLRFGVEGRGPDAAVVDAVLPLALAPDLVQFRRVFDARTTPPGSGSVYRHDYKTCDSVRCASLRLDDLYDRVLGEDGWWVVAPVFSHPDPSVNAVLSGLRSAAMSMDAAYALGSVLLACAYRRLILQPEGS